MKILPSFKFYFLLIAILYLITPRIAHAEQSIYRAAGWVGTDGSTAYTNTAGCQASNDGLYCSRPKATGDGNLYFSSFGDLNAFNIPPGSSLNKIYIRVKGKNNASQFVSVTNTKNKQPFTSACQQPTDLWRFFLGSTDIVKEVNTFTSANGLTSCITANNLALENLTIRLNFASSTAWFAEIDNLEIAFDYSTPLYQWQTKGNLSTFRSNHNAVKLSNGKVILVGGERTGLPLRQVDSYNHESGNWTLLAPLTANRNLQSTNVLKLNSVTQEEGVLVAGGVGDNGVINSAELYTPSSNTWINTSNLNIARLFHSSSVIDQTKVIVTGGAANTGLLLKLTATEVYDSISNTWTNRSPLNIARGYHEQVSYKDNQGNTRVMVIGGAGTSQTLSQENRLSSVEIYDPISNIWNLGPSMNSARMDFSSMVLQDGRILVAGGNTSGDSEVYNPTTNSWTVHTPAFPIKTGSAISLLASGSGNKVLVAGGNNSDQSAQLFDPITNTWTTAMSMNTPRTRFTLTTLNDGNVIAAGGISQGGQTITSELYRPPQVLGDTTTPTPSLSVSPTPAPFLDLPWDYKNERNVEGRKSRAFDEAAMTINSFFDHKYPLQSNDNFSEPFEDSSKLLTFLGSSGNGVLGTCTDHCYSGHDGYDYGSAVGVFGGDPVYPAAPGIAEYRYTNASGNLIYIDHMNGYQTRYYHLKDKGIFEGKAIGTKIDVVKDTEIGKVGNTGKYTSGAHIHFSVYQDTDKDGNFDDEEPFGATDPFGWQPEDNTLADPWAEYILNHEGLIHKGNESYYLWNTGQANKESFVGPEGGSMTINNATFNFHANTVPVSSKVKIKSAPSVKIEKDGKKYNSVGHSFSVAAYDLLGELKEAFIGIFTLTINFAELASYNIKPDTLSIYSSEDGVTWNKENTTIDMENGKATAEISHFSYFVLMGEASDTVPPVTTSSFNPSAVNDNWFRSDVTLSLLATESEEGFGLQYTAYRIGEGEWEMFTDPVLFSSQGTHVVDFYSEDKGGNLEEMKTLEFTIDRVAPVTSASVSGEEGIGGWLVSDGEVALMADDNGVVERTEYSLDGGETYVSYQDAFGVSNEGINKIWYRSVDKAGNVEEAKSVVVKIDNTAPSSLVYTTGSIGKNGWFTSDVSLSLNALEEGSGYDKTFISIDGENFSEYSEPISVTTEGLTRVYYYSTDKAGNLEETKEFVVKIDKSAPEVEFMYDISAVDIRVKGKDSISSTVSTMAVYNGTTGEVKIEDQAGNTLKVLVKDKEKGKNARLSIVSLQYNTANVITVDKNTFSVKYDYFDVTTNTIKKFDQDWKVNDISKVTLSYSQDNDSTIIKIRQADGTIETIQSAGKKFLKITTQQGSLVSSY